MGYDEFYDGGSICCQEYKLVGIRWQFIGIWNGGGVFLGVFGRELGIVLVFWIVIWSGFVVMRNFIFLLFFKDQCFFKGGYYSF